MTVFNHATQEITAKVVYYGPALSGKTTNLVWIHENLAFETKSELMSLATEQDRTLFFDFLALDIGLVRGMRTRLQLYTVPGQVYYESIRRLVLKGADAVVFVCDSQAALLEANISAFDSLRENIMANELDPNLPLVVQYNKRDLPSALPVAILNAAVNPRNIVPAFEAIATQGIGVAETLKGITKRLFASLSELYGPPDAVRSAETQTLSPRERGNPSVAVSSSVPAALEATGTLSSDPVATNSAYEALPAGTGLRPDQWFYLLQGKQHGPVDVDELIDLVLTSIPEGAKVWHPGLATWTRADLIPEIAEHIPPPLPLDSAQEEFPDFNTVPAMLRVVLIADEDAGFRRLLARPLAAQGFKIHEAKDGAEAWSIATGHRLWLILADLDMAEIDGFEFCRRVRSSSLLRHTPLVFVSGSDRYKDRYRALQLGADDFLSKQAPIRELLIRIQLLMTRYSDFDSTRPAAGDSESPGESGAFQGRIEVFGAPAVLQIINQGLLTGVFSARRQALGGDAAVFGFRQGQIISATCQDKGGAEAVYTFLTWDGGQFNFIPGDSGTGEPIANLEYLLLEGCRRMDEMRNAGAAGPDRVSS